jgi:hypothetical protein
VGKWCEVKCDCPNREPLPGSQWLSYSEYQKYEKKPRLAKTPEEWEEGVRGMYKCGHRDGAYIQSWPGDILRFGYPFEAAFKDQPNRFELFRRISDWRNYDDEYLALTPEDAASWQGEIEQLKRFLSGEEFLGWHEKEIFAREFSQDDLLYGDIESTLAGAMKFCEASAKTKNPIEFYW